MSVMSMKLIFFALYLDILSSSDTHEPGSASEVLIKRRSALLFSPGSAAGIAVARLATPKRAAKDVWMRMFENAMFQSTNVKEMNPHRLGLS